jgi:hypothetical protein
MSQLSKYPPDPSEILSESAQARIDRVLAEGSKTRDAVLKQYRHSDPESVLALDAANFDYAFQFLSALRGELKDAGVSGEQLKEIMRMEIQAISRSLELGDSAENQLNEILVEHDWGW